MGKLKDTNIMTTEEILQQIGEWANSSHACLPNRTEYDRGCKSGIYAAKEIILNYLKELEK